MAFIPNKELYIGLSGCVTALACLWANSMRKKNRDTKSRLRQELLDLRDLIIGKEEPEDKCNVTMPCRPCVKQPQKNICSEPRNFKAQTKAKPANSCNDSRQFQGSACANRRGSFGGMGSMNFSGPDISSLLHVGSEGADALQRGREFGAMDDLRKGTQAERYIVHPTPNGMIVSPIQPNQNISEVRKQQERIVGRYSPQPGPSGLQKQLPPCKCPVLKGGQRHKRQCPNR